MGVAYAVNCVLYTWLIQWLHFSSSCKVVLSLQTLPLHQGVVTYMSPVEASATRIKNLDQWKSSLIAWLLHSEALDCLILREFKGQNIAMPAENLRKCIDWLILVTQNSSRSLDRLLKRMLITWFHFDPGHKCFYRQRVCDYPLCMQILKAGWLARLPFRCPELHTCPHFRHLEWRGSTESKSANTLWVWINGSLSLTSRACDVQMTSL